MEPRYQADTRVTDMWAHAHIGRYVLLARVGEGGMGVVYRAHDPHLQRHVAVKLLRSDGGAQSQARLLREAQAMARLSHPAVVQVYDAGIEDGQVFIAMEYVDGSTLLRWLHDQPRTWQEVLDRFLAAGHGLAAAHAAGVVHRDFKPGNVLLSHSGRVLVGDFGLARPMEAGEQTSPAVQISGGARRRSSCEELASVTLTLTGAALGTPKYMSPEQRDGGTVDARADQFSFCVALVEGLYLAGAPDRMFDVLGRGLAADPAQRFATMDELLAALEWARMEPAPASAPRASGRTRTWLAGALALVAAAWIVRGANGGAAASRSAAALEPVPAAMETVSPREARAIDAAEAARTAALARAAPEPATSVAAPEPATSVAAPEPATSVAAPEPATSVAAQRSTTGEAARAHAPAPRRSSRRHRTHPTRARRHTPAHAHTGADRTGHARSAPHRRAPKEDPDGIIRDLWTSG